MEKPRVLYISQEITPYLPENHMSTIARNLPQGIQERGREIRTFMPRYGLINERRHQLHEVIRLSGMNLIIDDIDHPLIIKVASIQQARMQVYFIDNEEYFKRKSLYHDPEGQIHADNDERMIFFCRGVLETVKKLGWSPDIIHCHGWLTGLVPLYLKTLYKDDPIFANSKVVYSTYENDMKGNLDKNLSKKILFDDISPEAVEAIKKPTFNNVNILAMQHADAIIKGQKSYSPELEKAFEAFEKPILEWDQEDDYMDAYADFYDSIVDVESSIFAD
jgi:starch synthase